MRVEILPNGFTIEMAHWAAVMLAHGGQCQMYILEEKCCLPGNKPQLTKSKTFIVRFVWSILDSRPGGKLGGCLAEVLFANTCLLLYWYNRYAQVTNTYPGLPHLHAADFASTKADGQIDHLRLRWKWWCGVGAFSIIKIRAGGIATILEQKRKKVRDAKEKSIYAKPHLAFKMAALSEFSSIL